MNHKRVQRLCPDIGLRVRNTKRKRAHIGTSTHPADRAVATFPNHVWVLDFQFDQTTDARVLKLLNITDEFTKTALAIEVERSFTSDDMVRVLERLVTVHGTPTCIRMDNGTEMTAYVESFNGKIRDELLAIEEFTTLLEAKIMAELPNPRRIHAQTGTITTPD